jgi:serine/threonine protein phosphatase PrpC
VFVGSLVFLPSAGRNADEERRVRQAGGPIRDGRLLGLAVTRSFGDFGLRPYGLISTPHFVELALTPLDAFLVAATDGLWDVLSEREVAHILSSPSLRGLPAKELSGRLLSEALRRKTRDNVAVVVVNLAAPR